MKLLKNDFFQWGVLLSVLAILFFTGLHTEVVGQVQRIVLATGISQPDVENQVDLATARKADDLTLVPIDGGKKMKLSDFKGKVVFMNFWATWCGPCTAEMPNIHSLYEKTGAKDKEVVFIMVAFQDSKEKVKKYIAKKKYSFPVYILEDENNLPPSFDTNSIPVTFVITPDGKIAKRVDGMSEYDNDKFKSFLIGLKKKS